MRAKDVRARIEQERGLKVTRGRLERSVREEPVDSALDIDEVGETERRSKAKGALPVYYIPD